MKKTYFTWFGNVSTSMGTIAQTFTITEIGLHRRVFIITLDMTKLQKYPYTLNTVQRGTPQPIILSLQQKRIWQMPSLDFAPLWHLPSPFSLNMSHMPQHNLMLKY